MTTIAEWKYRIRDSFYFTATEWKDILITILAISFAFAYNDKSEVFNLAYWFANFGKVFFIVAIAIMIHIIVQKISALYIGFRAEYKLWSTGVYITILATLLTQGKIYIILAGGITFFHMTMLRLGHFRYGLNLTTSGMVAALGPLANLVLATFWETLALNGIYPQFFHQMTFINLYIAVFTMLPIPKLDGFNTFYGSRLLYAYFFSFLVAYIVLYSLGIFSLVWAAIIGFICYVSWWFYFERKTV